MDAKQRAQFINAQNTRQAGGGQAPRICPNCHAEVKSKFCTKCGTKYEEPVQEAANQEPAPEPKPFVVAAEEKSEPKPFVPAPEEEPKPLPPAIEPGPFAPVKEEKPAAPEIPPAAEAIVKRERKAPRRNFAFHPASIQTEEAEAEDSALARGLPEWSIEPPQVVVRRKHR